MSALLRTLILALASTTFVAALISTPARAASPCAESLDYLAGAYLNDRRTQVAFNRIYQGLSNLPDGYAYHGSRVNPWKDAGSGFGLHRKVLDMFTTWCTALPEIEGDSDNALDPILYFAWFYYHNPAGQHFVQGRDPAQPTQALETGTTFLSMWNAAYRAYMDSAASTGKVAQWVKDPRIEIDDYTITEPDQFKSWNQFFARNLRSDQDGRYPSRPVTMPERGYVIVSPTDCIMNPLVQMRHHKGVTTRRYIENPLQLDTVLDVKNIPISVNDMLGSAPQQLKDSFLGGSGLACVLMPNTYHHFHAPVDGTVVHAEIVNTGTPGTPGTFGYPDFPNWVPNDGNVGRPGTDFSQFQAFQRGVIIIRVTYANLPGEEPEMLTGHVASIPVGLDSVGSVVLNQCNNHPHTDGVNCFTMGGEVKKGVTKFGNFFFGGSLNILLFSRNMVTPAVQTRMGNQIGVINIGSAPSSPWSQ